MSKRPPKKARIQPIRHEEGQNPATESAVAVEDPPEQAQQTPEPAPPPKKGRGRPPGRESNPVRTQLTFFQRVDKIELADWGTRAKVKVYRLQPIIDQTRGSEFKFIQIYEEAVDENKIKVDHGSGRYRLYLNVKNAGEQTEKEIDMMEFDILDPRFPPNIPAGHWKDDSRNKKWVWAMPPGTPGGPPAPAPVPTAAENSATAATQFLEGVKIAGDIRKQVKDEMPAAPVEKASGLADTLQLVTTIMAMKADNPMNEVYRDEMRALRDELKEERAENRRLNTGRHNGNGEPNEKKFGLREALGELKEFLPAIKEIIPEVAARSGRTSWLDVAREVAPGVIDWGGRIALALASRMPPPTPGQQPQAPAQIAAPANGQQPPRPQAPPQETPAFFRYLAQPAVFEAFNRYFATFKAGEETGGADFANWIYDGGGAEPLKQARAVGSAAIMQSLKSSQVWMMFQADEAKLSEFIDQALGWNPDEAPAEDPDEDPDHVDFTKKGV